MGSTGLLTVLAILVAGYSLLSDEKRLDLKLRVSWIDYVFVGGMVLAILVVIYSPVILSGGHISPVDWRLGFDEETAVFTFFLAIIIFFGWKISHSRLPSSNYSKWSVAADNYIKARKFEQLGYLLERYHEQLFAVIDHQVWYVRLHNYLRPSPIPTITLVDEKTAFYKPILDWFRRALVMPFPGRNGGQEIIDLSVSRILKSKPFVAYLAETYPLVGAKATRLRFRDSDEYVTSYFEALVSQPGSSLYRELRDNQNCSYTGEYFLEESNPLLNFFFKDISVVKEVEPWQPIGNYIVEYIKRQHGQDNFYNQPDGRFSYDEERWACPIFVGCLFFQVMVSISIFRRAHDHMWLMYTENFIEEILNNLDRSSKVDMSREFPAKFDYLLYEIFSACSSWAGAAQHLDYEGVSDDDIQCSGEYWAAKTFGCILRKMISADSLSDSQKVYFLQIAVRRMRDLDVADRRQSSVLIFNHCIRQYEHEAPDSGVLSALGGLYRRVDHVLKTGDSTFEKGMASTMLTV
jgi:hypothetical protein